MQKLMQPKVLILVFSRLEMDARVIRQIRWLSQRFDVTSAAFGPSPVKGVAHIELSNLRPYRGRFFGRLIYAAFFVLGFYSFLSSRDPRNRAALVRLAGHEWDVIVSNDATALPLAMRLNARHGVLVDLHEYYLEDGEKTLLNRVTAGRYFRWVLRRHLTNAAAVTTVSTGIADRYFKEFGVKAEVVANAAPYVNNRPGRVASPIRIVHSAAPDRLRRIEVMIQAVRDTISEVTLDLYLVDDNSSYVESLRELCAGIERVRIHDPVPNSMLIETLNRYDVGIHLLPPINFNQLWALPNKFFDYVQARLGVIIGPSPEMKKLVSQYRLGAVAENFTTEALTRVLDEIDPEIVAGWKRSSHEAAKALSGEAQLEVFEQIVTKIVANETVRHHVEN